MYHVTMDENHSTEISSSPDWCGSKIDVEEETPIVVDLHIVTDVLRRECKYAIEREREREREREGGRERENCEGERVR